MEIEKKKRASVVQELLRRLNATEPLIVSFFDNTCDFLQLWVKECPVKNILLEAVQSQTHTDSSYMKCLITLWLLES